MKKILLLIAFLVIISCTPGGPQEPSTNFRTGSQGVLMSFVANQPPLRIYDDESRISVLLELQNLGAHPVGTQLDRIYISGFDHKIITPLEGPFNGKQIPNLEGKTADSPNQISKDYVEFMMSVSPLTVSKYPFKILATTCYGYQSIAESAVCIDPNPFTRSVRQKVCAPSSLSLGSQGGPITVSSVNVEARKQKTVFVFTVNNVGNGDVFKRSSMSQCSPYATKELDFNELDFVEVVDVKIGTESIKPSCKGLINNNYVRLNNGFGSFTCDFNTAGMGSEESRIIKIILDYGYRSTLFRDVELVHVP